MATLISEPNFRPLINFPIMIDQQFDLDEVLTFEEMSIQHDHDHAHDHHNDHDHQMIAATDDQEEATRNPNNNIPIAEAASAAAAADVGGSCAVCMESFHAGECREPIPCGHVYHTGCIAAWLSVCNSCPLCRRRVSGADQFSSAGKQ